MGVLTALDTFIDTTLLSAVQYTQSFERRHPNIVKVAAVLPIAASAYTGGWIPPLSNRAIACLVGSGIAWVGLLNQDWILAKMGNAFSQDRLGMHYWILYQGPDHSREDGLQAIEYFEKASHQGYKLARLTLAYIYCWAEEFQDLPKAVRLYQELLKDAHTSQEKEKLFFALGSLYAFKYQNLRLARHYFEKAVQNGSLPAAEQLQWINKEIKKKERDELITAAEAAARNLTKSLLAPFGCMKIFAEAMQDLQQQTAEWVYSKFN